MQCTGRPTHMERKRTGRAPWRNCEDNYCRGAATARRGDALQGGFRRGRVIMKIKAEHVGCRNLITYSVAPRGASRSCTVQYSVVIFCSTRAPQCGARRGATAMAAPRRLRGRTRSPARPVAAAPPPWRTVTARTVQESQSRNCHVRLRKL